MTRLPRREPHHASVGAGFPGPPSAPQVRRTGFCTVFIPRPASGPGRADMRAFRPLVRPLLDRPLRRPIAYDRFFGPHRPENFANAKPGHDALPGRFSHRRGRVSRPAVRTIGAADLALLVSRGRCPHRPADAPQVRRIRFCANPSPVPQAASAPTM